MFGKWLVCVLIHIVLFTLSYPHIINTYHHSFCREKSPRAAAPVIHGPQVLSSVTKDAVKDATFVAQAFYEVNQVSADVNVIEKIAVYQRGKICASLGLAYGSSSSLWTEDVAEKLKEARVSCSRTTFYKNLVAYSLLADYPGLFVADVTVTLMCRYAKYLRKWMDEKDNHGRVHADYFTEGSFYPKVSE